MSKKLSKNDIAEGASPDEPLRTFQKVQSQDRDNRNLSTIQKQILTMLIIDYETPRRIAIRRGTSIRAVYKTIKILKRKGVLNGAQFPHRDGGESTHHQMNQQKKVRLHAEEFNIKIYKVTPKYKEFLKAKTSIKFEGHRVRLFKRCLEFYSNQSFFADQETSCHKQSEDFHEKVFKRLEQTLKVELFRGEDARIRRVLAHYALTGNELAKEHNKRKHQLKIFGKEDGKLWLKTDNSFNMNELELIHPQEGNQDSERVREHFNYVRDPQNPTMPQMNQTIIQLSSLMMQLTQQVTIMGETIIKSMGISEQASKDLNKQGFQGESEDKRNEPNYFG
jgi:hypothetical protein